MAKSKDRIDYWITEYTKGESADLQAITELENWIGYSPKNLRYFIRRLEKRVSQSNSNKEKVFNKDKAYKEFKKHIGLHENEPEKISFRIPVILRYAFMATIICAFSYISFKTGRNDIKSNFSNIVVEAPRGSRVKLHLPDSTLIWLNAGSSLSYSQGFGIRDRKVELEGEGYFEVAHNKKMPFLVRSRNIEIKVLGTRFDFRDYKEDTEAAVTLMQGSISLKNLFNNNEKSILKPNEKAVLDKENGSIDINTSEAADACSWTKNFLCFDNEKLEEIINELQRSYNVNILLSNKSLGKIRFYGIFIRREHSIDEILEDLTLTRKIRYEKTSEGFIIY
ncbi:MAG: DUF4974 domain-containing protein [Bacteroidales bacterium]|jgi:ferric-dicitrate binding protein FerR (iron transport regulator)|nr:DUF4974 domain-containing protein [Bacteroidales bacterium]